MNKQSLVVRDSQIASVEMLPRLFESPFEIILCQRFEPCISEPIKFDDEDDDSVALYKYSGSTIDIRSAVYFEGEKLTIDYWKLGNSYEDEKIITIEKVNIHLLYKELGVDPGKKEELLQALRQKFKGEECFTNVIDFLNSKNIPFDGKNIYH